MGGTEAERQTWGSREEQRSAWRGRVEKSVRKMYFVTLTLSRVGTFHSVVQIMGS